MMEYNEQPGLILNPPPPQPTYEPKAGTPAYGQDQSAYTQNYGQYPPPTEDLRARGYTILGLRPSTFWLLLALIVVVVAAAVGGGVGGSLAVNNAKTQCLQSNACLAQAQSANSTATSTSASLTTSSLTPTATTSSTSSSATSTSTLFTAWGPLATSFPYTGCPTNNNTVYTSTLNPTKFQTICGLDIPNTGTSDLISAVTPTFELCMELCASWNDQSKGNGNASVPCKGIAYIPTHVNGDGAGNPIDCVLKSYATGLAVNPGYVVDSAIVL